MEIDSAVKLVYLSLLYDYGYAIIFIGIPYAYSLR